MKKIITIATVLLFLGCNTSTDNKTTSATADTSTATSTKTEASTIGPAGSDITVTLKGGANAGTYHVTTKDPTCSEGLTGENSFGNQYSEKGKADNELSSVQLIIDDKNAAKKGTDKFSFEVKFGKLLGGKSYAISTVDDNSGKSNDGSGIATLSESGTTKTVVIEGKTAGGVGISATIKCNSVITAG